MGDRPIITMTSDACLEVGPLPPHKVAQDSLHAWPIFEYYNLSFAFLTTTSTMPQLDWDRVKPKIRLYYRQQRKTLEEVRRLLEEEDHFVAA